MKSLEPLSRQAADDIVKNRAREFVLATFCQSTTETNPRGLFYREEFRGAEIGDCSVMKKF